MLLDAASYTQIESRQNNSNLLSPELICYTARKTREYVCIHPRKASGPVSVYSDTSANEDNSFRIHNR